MCMVDESDGNCTELSTSRPVARKGHRCMECYRTIQPGEQYTREAVVFEKEFTTYKTCRHCMVAREWLRQECGGWLFQGVGEDIDEHATNGLYGMGVMRLCIGMRHKWTRKDGRLMPIPRMPEVTP